ncbi:MAG: hypothetical protein WA655_01870 [Candidatus Korobacteraceae bacterium]
MSTDAQIVLPFAEREYIDARRACRILGVSYRTLMRLAMSGRVSWLDHGKLSWKRVRYKSVVNYCDRIREDHKIADQRPQLSAPYLRHKDEDLLPFPLQDTISAEQALEFLGFAKTDSLVRLIEEGRFEAYQLVPQAPWRVSRRSLLSYLDRLRSPNPASSDPRCYKVGDTSPHF